MKVKKLDGITALKGVACVCVFLCHAWNGVFSGFGSLGVSLFFIISGFTMIYGYYGMARITNLSIGKSVKFAFNKVSHLYPLYMVTMVAMLVFPFFGDDRFSILQIGTSVGLNAFLLQEWFPLKLRSINTVSWYLCVSVLSYFLFPGILWIMERGYNRSKAKYSLIILMVLQITIAFIGKQLQSVYTYLANGWWDQDLTHWLVYQFPLARILDFIIGCNLGYLFIHRGSPAKMIITKRGTFLEIIAGGGMIIAACIYSCMKNAVAHGYLEPPDRWWTYTFFFTPFSCLAVWLFAEDKTQGVALLTNKYTIYIARISLYMFLIHSVVLSYLTAASNVVFGRYPYCDRIGICISFFAGFPLSIACSHIWMKVFQNRIHLLGRDQLN